MESKTTLDELNNIIGKDYFNNHLIMKFVNYESNKKDLLNRPYTRIGDLAAVYKVDVTQVMSNQTDQTASYQITNDLMNYYGVTTEQLHKLALKNTPVLYPATLAPMSDTVQRIMSGEYDQDVDYRIIPERINDNEMYILSNTTRINGASVILYPGLLDQIGKAEGGNIFIIPSSIHETLILPNNGEFDAAALDTMVKEVNQDNVSAEETLSDHVYEYDVDERALYTATDHKLVFDNTVSTVKGNVMDKMLKTQRKNQEINIDPEIEM